MPLDNPIWSSLVTSQAHFALGDERAKRYSSEVAPFLATPGANSGVESAVTDTAVPGEVLYMLATAPSPPSGWEIEARSSVCQMVFRGRLDPADLSGEISVLGQDDVPEMLELTALAFPGFFRPRTIEMGRYFGIRKGGQLIAMAGERMYLAPYREVSGVCTHPDHRGQGHARQLINRVIDDLVEQGLTPFLHVGSENSGARTAYEKIGFVVRAELPLVRIRRSGGVRESDHAARPIVGHGHLPTPNHHTNP